MLYYFKKAKNATEMQKKKICAVYGECAVTDRMYQKLLVKMKNVSFMLWKKTYRLFGQPSISPCSSV